MYRLVEVYVKATSVAQSVIIQQSTGLVKAIGLGSPVLMQIITTLPKGSDSLILHFLNTLTEGGILAPYIPHNTPLVSKIPQQLVSTLRSLYQKKVADARYLVPILPVLDKEEIVSFLPKLVALPSTSLKSAITRLLQNAHSIGPSELLIALHLVDTTDQGQLKKVIEGTYLIHSF
jgi:symplekin